MKKNTDNNGTNNNELNIVDGYGNYLLIFISVLVSYAIYEYIKIFMAVLIHDAYKCILTPSFFLLIAGFILLIEYWWNSYIDRFYCTKSFLRFNLILLQPFIFYLFPNLLFPENINLTVYDDVVKNLIDNRVKVYILGIILLLIFIYSRDGFKIKEKNYLRYLSILTCILGIIFNSSLAQHIFSSVLLVCTITFIVIFCSKAQKNINTSSKNTY
jgi:hypothetical protein